MPARSPSARPSAARVSGCSAGRPRDGRVVGVVRRVHRALLAAGREDERRRGPGGRPARSASSASRATAIGGASVKRPSPRTRSCTQPYSGSASRPRGPASRSATGSTPRALARSASRSSSVDGVRIPPVQHVGAQASGELGEDPPGRSALPHRRHHRRRVLGAGAQADGLLHQHVGPLELAGRREHVRGHGGERAVDDVDHGQHVEAAQGGLGASGLREGGERVAACDHQRPQPSGLDLVDQGHARVLAQPAAQLRSAAGPGPGRAGAGAAPGAEEDPGVHPHAAGAVERAREHHEDPPQPAGQQPLTGHGDPGPAQCGDAAGPGPYVGHEVGQAALVEARRRGHRPDRERRHGVAERGDVVGVAPGRQLGRVGAVLHQRPHERRQHEVVGARAHRPGGGRPGRPSRCGGGRRPTPVLRRPGTRAGARSGRAARSRSRARPRGSCPRAAARRRPRAPTRC